MRDEHSHATLEFPIACAVDGPSQEASTFVEKAEEALRASEALFRTVVENSRDGINMLDLRTGRYVFVSRAQAALTGFSSEELCNLPAAVALERVHPDDRWISARQQEEIAQGKELPETVEYRWKVKSGEYRWFSDSRKLVRDANGSAIALVGVSRDITDRKQAEEALRASEARLSLLSRVAGELLRADEPQAVIDDLCQEVMHHLDCDAFFNFLVDPQRGKLHLNACAGVPADEMQRIEWLDLGVAVCGCVARDGARIIAEDILASCDPRADLVRSYGIQVYCCHPLIGRGGQILGTLSFGSKKQKRFSAAAVELMRIVADQVATAIQQMEARRALSLTNARLMEEDRRKNEFIAMLSHELRNPLAPIRNCLYVLDHTTPGGKQALRAKATIDRQVDQLTRLVDDLLDITRITRNKIQLRQVHFDLDELVDKTVQDYRPEFDTAGVALEHRRSSRRLTVHADANRIAQTIGNLLQNACKFTPSGGRVTVSVAYDDETKQGVIGVEDTGVGLSKDMLGRLFQPFMQADMSLDRSQGGLGLGLALVKGLVELHGGSVEAASEGLGRGTRFTVRLPVEQAEPAVDASGAASSAGTRQRVLIIEDNLDAADSLSDVLKLDGHEVAVAYNGTTGLSQAREFRPTVVLCDIGLPGMDGYEVAQAFRSDPALQATYLVALSGYALPEDLERAARAGFDRHMAKPPGVEQIQAVVSAAHPPRPSARPTPAAAGERPAASAGQPARVA